MKELAKTLAVVIVGLIVYDKFIKKMVNKTA